MIILAIDTCFSRCAVSLCETSTHQVLGEEILVLERGHAEVLAPMVERILAKAAVSSYRIERIAVTTGPGSFTGLRIGLSFARAFGQALNIPVIGLDTLHAVKLALAIETQPILIAHKAGQSGYYYVLHTNNSANIELLKLEDLAPIFDSKSQWIVGTGAEDIESYYNGLELKRNSACDLPNLVYLAHFASEQQVPTALPEPVYIREPDAKPQGVAKPTLRRVEPFDLAKLSQLHHACFEHGWSAEDLSQMLAAAGTSGMVVEQAQKPLAFIILRQMFDEAEILTLATAPSARKQGHAQALIKAAQGQGLAKLHLEVAASNLTAQSLYAKNGFQHSGLRKAYYAKPNGPAEDAVLMVWRQE